MTAFTRTFHSLQADGFRRAAITLSTGAGLLALWTAWFVSVPVTRYETTDIARLEVDQSNHPVQAPYAGRVTASRLALGRQVTAGEVLVELDARPERLEMQEQRARNTVLNPQLDSLRAELAATIESRKREQAASDSALAEARARVREAEVPAQFAAADASRSRELMAAGLTPAREDARAQSEAERAKANVESIRRSIDRLEREQRTRESDRDIQIRRLENEIRRMEGEKVTNSAAIDRLQYELEKRVIRAPVSGKLGEVASIQAGTVVREGDVLGAIVPPGGLRIVAQFPPAAALGRIRAGQPARLRLKGFPWAQYGSIAARVSNVAAEIRDGSVRVECDLLSTPGGVIPAQHGLPGSIEVQVERVTPLALLLRTAGQRMTAPISESGRQDQ